MNRYLSQDQAYHVRLVFLTKVIALLVEAKLPAMMNMIVFMCAHDPEDDIRTMVRIFCLFYTYIDKLC